MCEHMYIYVVCVYLHDACVHMYTHTSACTFACVRLHMPVSMAISTFMLMDMYMCIVHVSAHSQVYVYVSGYVYV